MAWQYNRGHSSIRFALACLVPLLALLAFSAMRSARAAGVMYVRSGTSGASWTDAYTSPQTALSAASSGDQIWVAAGTYTPSTTGERSASFTLKNGVAIYPLEFEAANMLWSKIKIRKSLVQSAIGSQRSAIV